LKRHIVVALCTGRILSENPCFSANSRFSGNPLPLFQIMPEPVMRSVKGTKRGFTKRGCVTI